MFLMYSSSIALCTEISSKQSKQRSSRYWPGFVLCFVQLPFNILSLGRRFVTSQDKSKQSKRMDRKTLTRFTWAVILKQASNYQIVTRSIILTWLKSTRVQQTFTISSCKSLGTNTSVIITVFGLLADSPIFTDSRVANRAKKGGACASGPARSTDAFVIVDLVYTCWVRMARIWTAFVDVAIAITASKSSRAHCKNKIHEK